jgi:hypothetical protein
MSRVWPHTTTPFLFDDDGHTKSKFLDRGGDLVDGALRDLATVPGVRYHAFDVPHFDVHGIPTSRDRRRMASYKNESRFGVDPIGISSEHHSSTQKGSRRFGALDTNGPYARHSRWVEQPEPRATAWLRRLYVCENWIVQERSRLPRLASDGDKTERDHWGHMVTLVPHYETFWQRYVHPLRANGSIWFRQGLDPDLENIAIASYSTYAALARARERIYSRHEGFRYLEELYSLVQRSAEIGVKLVNYFAVFHSATARRPCPVSAGSLEEFISDRLKRYRNLLHDEMLAMPKDEHGRRLIPKPDHIDKYRRWTTVMYGFCAAEFAGASEQVRNDFRATCSLLEEAWKGMSDLYEDLMPLTAFKAALSKGRDAPGLMATAPASGAFFLGASSAGCQPTSGAFEVATIETTTG